MTLYRIDAAAAKTGDEIRAVDDAITAGVLVPVEPWWIGVILRDCLPLINDHQVAAVIEALGVGEETP